MADERSDGSDIEVDRDAEEDLQDLENFELLAVHDPELRDYLDEVAQQIFESDSEDDQDFHGFHAYWRQQNFDTCDKRQYQRNRGLAANVALPQEPKAVDFFELFWDAEMWLRLVTETNRYAEQERTARPPPQSFLNFKAVTEEEMKTFIGLCLMMGILRLPKRSDYWRTKETCWLAHTNFGKAMSRNRFDCILRYLHLQDNTARGPNAGPNDPRANDKLFKIRVFLDGLLNNYKCKFTPGNYVLYYVL